MTTRRDFCALPVLAGIAAVEANVILDPAPQFELSPYLYMQFMEPLGATDSSVEAAWDYERDEWRADFVAAVQDLAPEMVRFGGLLSRYYKWREGVGPAANRPWYRNYVWGGKETHRVGTAEFVDFCRRVKAEPLYCVNFLSDGESRYRTAKEGNRTGDAREAADWVSYANDPANPERRAHGAAEPYGIRFWQLGNETSYGNQTFTKEQAIARTIEFAKAMRARDAGLRLIGWGDRRGSEELWAPEMIRQAGEHLQYVAIHMMGQSPRRPDTVLNGNQYQKDPEAAFRELLELADRIEARTKEAVEAVESTRSNVGLAITEGHLSLRPHNANPVLTEWLSAVYHARSFNIYERYGRCVKIATAADFQGNRWTVNAVMLQTPGKVSYLTPAGSVMRLFRKHKGTHAISVPASVPGLDIAASISGNRAFLHVVNVEYKRGVDATFGVKGRTIESARVWQIGPADLRQAVSADSPDVFRPVEKSIPATSPQWTFPPGAVAVVELDLAG